MACGCRSKKTSNNRALTNTSVPPRSVALVAPPVQSVATPALASVNLPPIPKMDVAAVRRLKQLNKDAVKRMFGR